MNKYQKEIENLLVQADEEVNKELYKAYTSSLRKIKSEVKRRMQDYESLSFLQRMEFAHDYSLMLQIEDQMDILSKKQDDHIYRFLNQTGELGYNALFYEFEQMEKIRLNFTMLPKDVIETIIQTPVAGIRLSERLRDGVIKDLKNNLQSVMTSGFIKGASYQEMAQGLSEVGQSSYKRALNIARTEGGRVQAVTRQKAQKDATDMGINVKKQWVATLDGKTRDDHRVLDGQIKEVDEYFEVNGYTTLQPHMFGVAKEDCNCRCRTINVIKGYEHELRLDNENREVIAYKNYKDWVNRDIDYEKDLVTIYTKTNGNRKKLAEELLAKFGIDVPVEIQDTDARGYNRFKNLQKGKKAEIGSFVLQANDDRDNLYQLKTVFHETYHSRLAGLEVPISKKFTMEEWMSIEEVFTEVAAHYQMSLVENKKLMPAYSKYIAYNLPKLQQLDEFKDCYNLIDFGKVAMKYRFSDEKTADWREKFKYVSDISFDFKKYVRDNYIEELKENKAKILHTIYENNPAFREYDKYIKEDYDNFINIVSNREMILGGNEKMIGEEAITALYRLKGVKSWK